MEPTSGAFSQKKKKKLQVQNSIFFGNIDTDKNFILNTKSEHKRKKRLGEKSYSCVRCRDLSYSEEKKKKKKSPTTTTKKYSYFICSKMGNLCGLRINPTQPELTMVGIDPFFHKSKNVQIQFCQIYIPHTFFQ